MKNLLRAPKKMDLPKTAQNKTVWGIEKCPQVMEDK